MAGVLSRIGSKQIYVALAALLLVFGAVNLSVSVSQINRRFGGFLWVYDASRSPPYYVAPVPWRMDSLSPTSVQFLDTLLSIDEQPVAENPELYAQKDVGAPVTYRVLRNDNVLTVIEPVRTYSLELWLLIQVLFFLIGVSAVASGFTLLAKPSHAALTLVAFSLLTGAGAAFFFVGEYSGLTPGPAPLRLPWLILGAPTAAVIGTLILHAALLYPEPAPAIQKAPHLPMAFYAVAAALAVAYAATSHPELRTLNESLLRGMQVYAGLCLGVAVAIGMTTYRRLVHTRKLGDIRAMQALLLIWGTLTGIIVVFWLAPYIMIARPLLPYEVLGGFFVLFPIGIAYGMRHSQAIRTLAVEEEQLQLLRQSREKSAQVIADHLHDTVLPELYGARLLVANLSHEQDEQNLAREDWVRAVASLEYVTRQVRQVMEDIKPIDWSAIDLQTALGEIVERYRRRTNGGLPVISLEVSGYDEADPALVKDALFVVGKLALDNAYRHANAQEICVTLNTHDAMVSLHVSDNGVGFDRQMMSTMQTDRRHVGLENMQRRAAEVGGKLSIASEVGRGTTVTISVPRPPR